MPCSPNAQTSGSYMGSGGQIIDVLIGFILSLDHTGRGEASLIQEGRVCSHAGSVSESVRHVRTVGWSSSLRIQGQGELDTEMARTMILDGNLSFVIRALYASPSSRIHDLRVPIWKGERCRTRRLVRKNGGWPSSVAA